MSRVESQLYLMDLCGDLVPVLDTEPLGLLRCIVRWFLLTAVLAITITLWATTKVVNTDKALSLMAVGLAIVAALKWLLHG
jgi:hypothetical protein